MNMAYEQMRDNCL